MSIVTILFVLFVLFGLGKFSDASQEKRYFAAQKRAGAKRKEVRRVANENAGLLHVEAEEDNDANDANEANNRVFKRRSPSKVLLKTKDLCNGYF